MDVLLPPWVELSGRSGSASTDPFRCCQLCGDGLTVQLTGMRTTAAATALMEKR